MLAATAMTPTFASSDGSVAWILGADALPGHVEEDRVALRWGGETRTYAQLRGRVLSLARALRELGLERGDRVGGHLLNRGESFELYFACAYAGLTFVPLNFRLTPYEIGLILSDCAPRAIFTQAEVAASLREAIGARDDVQVVTLGDDDAGPEYEALAGGEPLAGPFEHADPQLIMYTSGTTGRPKGVMLAHRNILSFALQQVAMYPDLTRETTVLITAPTFNTAGINETSIPAFLVGGTVALHPSRGWRPRAMAELIDAWGVTHTIVFPSMMEPLLEADREAPIALASLRFVLTGGENCPPATMARFRARWPHVYLAVGYGSTESGVITLVCDDEIERHAGSVGRAALGMTFRVQGPDGEPVAPGEVGEIWAAGGSIVAGYWNAPELSAATVRDGWLNSGDLGRLDADGYLFIEGRSRDLIISKGQNIYPAEVENVLSEDERLLEATVVGVPDEEYGEVVCAVVVAKPGREVSADSVVEFVRTRLASYKKPRHVLFTDTLPRNVGNKVRKGDVAAWARGELGLDG